MQALLAGLEPLVSKSNSKNNSAAAPKIIESLCNLINYLSNAPKVKNKQFCT